MQAIHSVGVSRCRHSCLLVRRSSHAALCRWKAAWAEDKADGRQRLGRVSSLWGHCCSQAGRGAEAVTAHLRFTQARHATCQRMTAQCLTESWGSAAWRHQGRDTKIWEVHSAHKSGVPRDPGCPEGHLCGCRVPDLCVSHPHKSVPVRYGSGSSSTFENVIQKGKQASNRSGHFEIASYLSPSPVLLLTTTTTVRHSEGACLSLVGLTRGFCQWDGGCSLLHFCCSCTGTSR